MTFDNNQEYLNELIHLKNDPLDKFEIRLLKDEITCIEPYFDGHFESQRSYHYIMVRNGRYIDKLIETNDEYVIAEIVQCGYAQEHYKEWAQDSEYNVQEALLEKDLYIDILSQSKNDDIRFEVAKRYPDMVLDYLKTLSLNEQRWYGFEILMSQTKPNKKALKFLFKLNWHRSRYNLQILKSKYKVMYKIPTVIEKTMTPFQLYQTRNPLWKHNLSGHNISCVKYGQKKFNNKKLILTEDDFKLLSCCENTYSVDQHIEWRLTNRKD